jgi:ABC-type spermidine/putrescine transport system permease subunit II
MSIYTIVLFLHVSGAIGYFIGIGIWLFGLATLRRAQRVEQVRSIANLVGLTGPLFAVSVLLILVTGLYRAFTAWGLQTGWIDVALISLILMAPLGTALVEPRRRAIDRMAREAPDGPLPESLEQRTHDPLLGTTLQTLATLLLGIVFLMTTKPSLPVSLIVIAVALALGLASGLLVSRAARTQVQRADARAGGTRGPLG